MMAGYILFLIQLFWMTSYVMNGTYLDWKTILISITLNTTTKRKMVKFYFLFRYY